MNLGLRLKVVVVVLDKGKYDYWMSLICNKCMFELACLVGIVGEAMRYVYHEKINIWEVRWGMGKLVRSETDDSVVKGLPFMSWTPIGVVGCSGEIESRVPKKGQGGVFDT